jgi:hypothetical protein
MEHHDPSNIVRHDGRYYLWFTEHSMYTDGFRGGVIKYATSKDGLDWRVRGVAIDHGAPGGPDATGVLTPYVVPAEGAWYLFFLSVGQEFTDPGNDPRGIWLARAESPDGPWFKQLDAPVLRPGPDGAWDALCCDDPNVIFRDGTWGIDVMTGVRPRYLYRFDCSFAVDKNQHEHRAAGTH